MSLSVSQLLLSAKQREIEELRRLVAKAGLVSVIGRLIHALQSERGASAIYLASAGTRFMDTRNNLVVETQAVELSLREAFEAQLGEATAGNAKLFSLMAWVLLGLEELPTLRTRISQRVIKVDEAILGLSRLVAGLIALIFEVADAALDPEISRALVALFNFIQGKELAGQERALGGLCFASGRCEAAYQQRVLHLVDAQEKHFQSFAEFADPVAQQAWQALEQAPYLLQVERLRRVLASCKPDGRLETSYSDSWFSSCSQRIGSMWQLQCELLERLGELCAGRMRQAEQNLADSTGLIRALMEHPPSDTGMLERFFDPSLPVDATLPFLPSDTVGTQLGHSILSVLQAQSAHLARTEGELDKARRALNERKVVERAKGALMAHLKLSEEEAYKMLRKTAMDQNRRLADVAEATLSLPFFASAAAAAPHQE